MADILNFGANFRVAHQLYFEELYFRIIKLPFFSGFIPNYNNIFRQCPEIGQQYGTKNKAAFALQCKLNGKLIAALLFILYISLI